MIRESDLVALGSVDITFADQLGRFAVGLKIAELGPDFRLAASSVPSGS
jgi:hypothetical protein